METGLSADKKKKRKEKRRPTRRRTGASGRVSTVFLLYFSPRTLDLHFTGSPNLRERERERERVRPGRNLEISKPRFRNGRNRWSFRTFEGGRETTEGAPVTSEIHRTGRIRSYLSPVLGSLSPIWLPRNVCILLEGRDPLLREMCFTMDNTGAPR